MAVTINGSSGLTANDGSVFTDASGDVLIGSTTNTFSGDFLLQRAANTTNLDVFAQGDATANNIAKVRLYNNFSNGAIGLAGDALVFYNANTDTERMRITAGGNVGIGTSSPTRRLDVTADATSVAINIRGRSADNIGALTFDNNAGNGGSQVNYIQALNNSGLRFGTNNAERARIDSTGNFLLAEAHYYGMNQYTNKKYMQFNYPTTGFGAFNDCTDFSTAGNGSGLVQMRISQGGSVGCRGSFSGGQTLNDYAEYFEWSDGNPDNQDRIGVTVVLDGDTIRPSTEQDSGDDIVGVVSGTAGVVLGSSPFEWSGKYQKDEFGRIITEKVTWVHWAEGDTNHNYKVGEVPDGVVVPADADYKTYDNPIVVENYDESAEYQSRDQRKEWAPIGLVGQVHVKNGQLVGTRWRKMKDVSDNVALWLIR